MCRAGWIPYGKELPYSEFSKVQLPGLIEADEIVSDVLLTDFIYYILVVSQYREAIEPFD